MSIARIFTMLMCLLLSGVDGHGLTHGAHRNKKEYDTKIKYVAIKELHWSDLKTIGEYFGDKKEHNYFRCVARGNDNKREGVYFIVGLNKSVADLPKDLFAKISLITSLKEPIYTFKCKVPEDGRCAITSEIYCGAMSIPTDISKINAWKVEFVDGDDNILFSKQSYMWKL